MDMAQYRMAKAALGWAAGDVARAAAIDSRAVARFEAGGRLLPGQLRALQQAFESFGVEFFEDGLARGAVRLKPADIIIPAEPAAAAAAAAPAEAPRGWLQPLRTRIRNAAGW
jgi:transcriptional regulator with XRE-family HTH domain